MILTGTHSNEINILLYKKIHSVSYTHKQHELKEFDEWIIKNNKFQIPIQYKL